MSQRGRERGKETGKLTSKAMQMLSTDIAKYRTSYSQELQRKDAKNIHVQRHTTQNMTSTTTQRQTPPLPKSPASLFLHTQSYKQSCLHASSSSFSHAQSYKHMPSPSAPLKNKLISSHSPLTATQSFVRNVPPTSKSLPQRKQTSSCSPSPATQSFARNIPPASKSLPERKQTSPRSPSRTSSRSRSPSTKSFTQNIQPPLKPPSQHKQALSRPPSPVQRNRPLSARQEHEEETQNEVTSRDIERSLRMIMTQLNRMEKRQISIENKTDENTKAIKRLMRESTVRRPVKPQGILFKTVDDFLAFEEVDEEIYNDLVGYFIYLGRANPVDCAAEYFRSVFPENEEVSSYLTLNGRTGPGGCKLRDSRFAQACQDAINANKHFPNPNNDEFYDVFGEGSKKP